MSAPLVINLRDGSVWERRAMTAAGVALYALAGSCSCPEYLMASESELAAQGIAGTADVLPVPVGSELSELERMRLRVDEVERAYTFDTAELKRRIAELLAERHSTNESLDDAVQELRARPNFFQPGHTYAARVGWPGGRERFRFICESVSTDPESGEPHALGQHGRRGVDGEWIWTPNPRTHDDWRGGAWTDITDEVPREVEDVTPQVRKLQALLAGQRAQAGDLS